MSQLTSDFFENEEQALRNPNIVLRDSLGTLAVQILCAKENIAELRYDVLLRKLHTIISELHTAYQNVHNDFTE